MEAKFDKIAQFFLDYTEKRLRGSEVLNKNLRPNFSPEEMQEKISFRLNKKGESSTEIIALLEKIIAYSLNTNHPFFMNQMYGKVQPIALVADMLLSLLNTSMYTYEVAPVFTHIEKEIIGSLSKRVWGKTTDGVFTAGGSLSNMMALFLARQNYLEKIKQKGLFCEKKFSIFISDNAHYSFIKGVNFMGLGIESLVMVSTNTDSTINTDTLETAIEKEKRKGRIPLMVVGIAGTTVTGFFDDLETLAKIAKNQNLWFHVDAAYGGSLLFSDTYKHRLKGCENADSLSWNFHKVMGMPVSTSSFLTKKKGILNKAFNVDANYLFHQDDFDFDLGQKSLRGGRRPDAFKIWLTWKYLGENGLREIVEKLLTAASTFSNIIESTEELELFERPQSSIVCFRYVRKDLSEEEVNQLNTMIRNTIFSKGEIIFNHALIQDHIYLRCVLLDPNFSLKQLKHIVNTIINTAKDL